MKLRSIHFLPVVICFVAGGLSDAKAATPLPPWYGQPSTTRQGYLFTTGSQSPAPNIPENPYGTPTAAVVLGGFSDGWQDPANPIDLSGVVNDGAWDLGTAGTITVTVPFTPVAASPGTSYRVDFEVYTVAYLGITALPTFSSPGLVPTDLTYTQSTVAPDPGFPGASWQGLLWTGYFDNLTSSTIDFQITAPANNTSVVDTMEVFTRVSVVPEPSALLLLVAPVAALVARRRRG